jgi:hypothetical protein
MLRNVAQENRVEGVDVVCLSQESVSKEVKPLVPGSTPEQASLRCKGFIEKSYVFCKGSHRQINVPCAHCLGFSV